MITEVYINGLKGYRLENDAVSLTVLLQGAKIISMFDKHVKREWLWSPQGAVPKKYETNNFDCQWFGGMDDLFPNDIPSKESRMYSVDHGLLWHPNWKAVLIEQSKLVLELQIEEMQVFVQKSIQLNLEGFVFSYSIENQGAEEINGLLRIHPAFAMESGVKLTVPAEKAFCDRVYHSPSCDTVEYNWPNMPISGKAIDLSHFSNYESIQEILQYLVLEQGKFELSDYKKSCRICFRFERQMFPILTVYACNNSIEGTKVVVAEPSTGRFSSLEEVRTSGDVFRIAAHEKVEFDITTIISNMEN